MSIDIARSNNLRYGEYPVAVTFANNDHVGDLPDTSEPAYSAAFDPNDGIKRHAACDECRKRKLKCSGEPTGCSRCVKQNLICHYSEQKQMGRPRKRQKTDSDPSSANKSAASPPRPIQPAPEPVREQWIPRDALDPNLSLASQERTQFENICNAPIAQTIRASTQIPFQDNQTSGMYSNNSSSSHSQNGLPTPESGDPFTTYPTDVAQWPDFSTLDMLPLPVDDKWKPFDSGTTSVTDPDVNPEALSNLPSVPACPCLPNLYLTLSTMSTLSSFPFNQQTISTIETAYKTAKGVIYCPVCPQKFDSGSSNLMLGCTLLNVLADQWNRFCKLGVDELRKAFGTLGQQSVFLTTKEGQEWRQFSQRMLRAYVFGDQGVPAPPGSNRSPSMSSLITPESDDPAGAYVPSITLMGLCDALTRRQRQWHRLDEPTDEFPDRVTPDLAAGHIVGQHADHPGRHLCLEIVNHARCMVESLAASIRLHQ